MVRVLGVVVSGLSLVVLIGCGSGGGADQPPIDAGIGMSIDAHVTPQPDAAARPDSAVAPPDAAGPDAGSELDCKNQADDDGDGLVDCADPECAMDVDCLQPEACADGVDNDGDMKTDCADVDCVSDPHCREDCDDLIDNDLDTTVDCADADCAMATNCMPETACGDLADNDLDGAVDCADSDCFVTCATTCPDGSTLLTVGASGLPMAIDNTTPSVIAPIMVGTDGVVTRAIVHVTAPHVYSGDLVLTLISPAGMEVVLTSENGGGFDNAYVDTIFTDDAPVSVTSKTPPYAGPVKPEEPLSAMAGQASDGTWTIKAEDTFPGADDGSLDVVELSLCWCNGTEGCEFGAACLDGVDNDGDMLVDCSDPACSADPRCIPEASCDDGVDQDLDGATDCADEDCDGVGSCEHGTETTCGDLFDNDVDGATDCADSDCEATATCAPEADCGDGLDDDGDGAADCMDVGCDGASGCEFGTEASCHDGEDNDADGDVDCADEDCADTLDCAVPACPTGSTRHFLVSTDTPKVIADNASVTSTITFPSDSLIMSIALSVTITHTYDGDLDLSLQGPGGVPTLDLSSDNGAGGDDYTNTIFTDLASGSILSGIPPYEGAYRPEQPLASLVGLPGGAWSLVATDDATGDIGALVGWSLVACTCTSCEVGLACRDSADQDGDMLVDCADPDCATDATCKPEDVCDDEVDQDLDGLIDCFDDDCDGVSGCEVGAEVTCDDLFDNDTDGQTDCADANCATAPSCVAEVQCDNGLDDDLDGPADCSDPDCTGSAACVPEADCANGMDDDGDGAADCTDPGCAAALGCEFGGEVTCNDAIDNDSDGAVDCADTSCAWACATLTCTAGEVLMAFSASGLPQTIPTTVGTRTDTIHVAGHGMIAQTVVRFDALHTWVSDLKVTLQAPNTIVRDLTSGNGGAGDNYVDTVFSDTASLAIVGATAPFTGMYRPEQPLGAFTGTDIHGDWLMSVTDSIASDGGTWRKFDLAFCVSTIP